MTALSDLRYRPEWVRPIDWLPLPDIQPPTEGIAALVAVSEDGYGNLVSLKMTISDAATWTVDWGDGSTPEVIASGATATHEYDWADVADVTSEGWRQAVLTVYPATSKTFTTINLAAPVGAGVRNTGWTSPLKDVLVSAAAATSALLGDSATRGGRAAAIESAEFRLASGQLAYYPMCYGASSLRRLRLPTYTSTPAGSASGIFQYALVPPGFQLGFFGTSLNSTFSRASVSDKEIIIDLGGRTLSSMYAVFADCSGPETVQVSNAANATAFHYFASNSPSLRSITLSHAKGTVAYFGNAAYNLKSVVVGDASGVTTTTAAFSASPALERLILTGLTIGVSVANCNLGAAALNAFFTALGTAAGAQTITITGNPGAGTCDPSIATAKGFTVVN